MMILLGLVAVLPPSLPQGGFELLWKVTRTNQQGFGHAVAAVPDLDGDGFVDLLCGEPEAADLAARGGAIEILSSRNHARLLRIASPAPDDYLGSAICSLDDVDGDGWCDVAASAPGASAYYGAVRAFSSRTGALLWSAPGAALEFGHALALLSDLDGDGIRDLAASYRSDASRIDLLSGLDGSLIRFISAPSSGTFRRASLAAIDDLDLDGHEDLIVGDPENRITSRVVPGAAHVFSPATGALLRTIHGTYLSGRFGSTVAGLTDLDLDGFGDFAVGGEDEYPYGRTSAGAVHVYSGATGSELLLLPGLRPVQHASIVTGVGDQDRDGVEDLLVGGPCEVGGRRDPSSLALYSGADGSQIHLRLGPTPADGLGCSLAALDDMDGDGRAEFAAGATLTLGYPGYYIIGSVLQFRATPALEISDDEWSASVGGSSVLALDFPLVQAGFGYALLLSLAGPGTTTVGGFDLPLADDRWLRACLGGRYPPLLIAPRGTLDARGDALAGVQAGPGALTGAIGATVWFAAVSIDPIQRAPAYASKVVSLRILP